MSHGSTGKGESPKTRMGTNTPLIIILFRENKVLLAQRSERQVSSDPLSEYLTLMLSKVPGESDFAVLNYIKLGSTDVCKEAVCFGCAAYRFESA